MEWFAAALWSINERLGGEDGASLPPLTTDWFADVAEVAREESEAVEEMLEDMDRRRQDYAEGW